MMNALFFRQRIFATLILAGLMIALGGKPPAQAAGGIITQGNSLEVEKLPSRDIEWTAASLTDKPRIAPANVVYPSAITPDPLIQAMIDQVTLTDVYSYTGELSGEWSVMIGEQPYTITTRYTESGEPIQKATQFVGEHLAALGLDVEYHTWRETTNPNVIGELPGLVNPEQIYIIGAHLDNLPPSGSAPGADDNASGSAAVLLAADILSQYRWGCTLRFAFWTGEEQYLSGSEAYAERAYFAGEDIRGYLNLDMIAWNTGGSAPGIDLIYEPTMPATLQLAQLFSDTVGTYGLTLTPELTTTMHGGSDHIQFWFQGYPAILGTEDQDDFNPNYHTIDDDMDNVEDWPYYVDFVKAAVGTFAHMNGCLISGGLGAMQGTVRAANNTPIENATITFESDNGSNLQTNTNASGYYTQTLLAETYTVTAQAYGYTPAVFSNVTIITDSTTTQDIALTVAPTYTLSGHINSIVSSAPLTASIIIEGSPVTLSTDPTDGSYEVSLPSAAYTLKVHAIGYRTQERAINLTGDQVQDFSLEKLPCILLVDDDDNSPVSPDVQGYYTSTFNALGLDYDLRDTVSQDEPGPADLDGYQHVFWFVGYDFNNTLTKDDETALGNYLDGGGNLFLSTQDYLYDRGPSTFQQNYLHLASFESDLSHTSVSGSNIFQGLGPYSLIYPFSNWSDAVEPDAIAQVAFTGDKGNAAVSYNGGTFHTVFLAFPLEAIPEAGRQETVSRILNFFGGCSSPADGHITGLVSDAVSGESLAGAALETTPEEKTTTAGAEGNYDLMLTPGLYALTVQHACYISETIPDLRVYENLTTTQNIALQPLPPQAEIASSPVSVEVSSSLPITRNVTITNQGCSTLTYTATVTTNSPWLTLGAPIGNLTPSEESAIQLTMDADGLEIGVYTATISIQTNDPAQTPTTISVNMTVVPVSWQKIFLPLLEK